MGGAAVSEPPVLLLDVMDTLVVDPFHRELPAFFGLTLPAYLAQKHPTLWLDFERGLCSEADFLDGLFRDRRRFDHDAFIACVQGAYRWVEGMEPLLIALTARGVALHALSNYPVWYLRIEKELRLSRYLRWSGVSCITGLRKPDEAAFLTAAAAAGRPPSGCLLVDDREANCVAARAVGMDAVRFEGAGPLRAVLEARGVL